MFRSGGEPLRSDSHGLYSRLLVHTFCGNSQLFYCRSDPNELNDLSDTAVHQAELRKWRSRMVEHLTPSGEPIVRGGKTAIRRSRTHYSPDCPSPPAATRRAGDRYERTGGRAGSWLSISQSANRDFISLFALA